MIKTSGEIRNILNNGDALKWAKDYEMNVNKKITLDQLPKLHLSPGEAEKDFSNFLLDSIKEVNSLQINANNAIQKLVTGESKNIHETMLMVEKADLLGVFAENPEIGYKVMENLAKIIGGRFQALQEEVAKRQGFEVMFGW